MIFPFSTTSSLFLLLICGLNLDHVLGSEEILQRILNDTFYDYDKNIRPSYGVRPVEVKVAIHVVSISRVDTSNQEYTMDFILQQTWSDQRLAFAKPRVSNITMEAEYIRRLWTPDVNFITDRSNTVINEHVTLRSNGEIQKSLRLSITTSCPMKLKDFPFDSPVCPLHIESFSGPVQDIRYVWERSPLEAVTIADDAAVGDFSIARFRLKSNDSSPIMVSGVGVYSRLTLEIQLKRILGRYEYDFSCFTWIVILSISTLWIGNTKLSVALSTVNLVIVLLLNNIQVAQLHLPKWAQRNWLDCYVHLSSTFIFFVILANLLELNMPDQLELSKQDKDEKEIELKEDEENRKDNQGAASVSAQQEEDEAKLCRASDDPSTTKRELSPVDQILALKSKLDFVQRLLFTYVQTSLPYLRWSLLVGFFVSHFIFWKSIPEFKPLPDII